MTARKDGLRIIFAGTPVFAAHHLQALLDSPHRIVAVYTRPDRQAGRGKQLTASPVKKLALAHNIATCQPVSLKDSTVQQQLKAHQADVMVVVAYGLLLPKAVLEIPRFGCFNVHGSLLPRWRGAAPIQRAILAGDTLSGVTIMQMDEGLDTGDILYKSECPIGPDETAASLHDKLMFLGAAALLETLALLQQDELQPVPQNNKLATGAEKITKGEALVDWTLPASTINICIRAYNPFPVAWTFLNEKRIKIFRGQVRDLPGNNAPNKNTRPGEILALDQESVSVACGSGVLAIRSLQLPGKKIMTANELINGYQHLFMVGKSFGQ